MNPIRYFILIAVVLFAVSNVCFAEDADDSFIGPRIEAVNEVSDTPVQTFNPDIDLSDEIREDIMFYTRKLQSRDSELDALILLKISDNILSASEMKEINDKVNSAASLNEEAKSKLDNYYWKINFKIIQSIDFKNRLFNPYFSPFFKERDKNNQLKDYLYRLTGKRVIIENHFNKTALTWDIICLLLGFGLFIIGINDFQADFLAGIGFIVGFLSLIILITGLCGL